VTDDEITLLLYAPEHTGGSDLLEYELWIDGGELNTVFEKVTSYSGSPSSLIHTLEKDTDSLTPGLLYSIKFRARNAVGYSTYSDILRVGLGDEPPSITGLTADIENCGPSFVAMSWPRVSTPLALTVLGYVV